MDETSLEFPDASNFTVPPRAPAHLAPLHHNLRDPHALRAHHRGRVSTGCRA